MKVSIELYGILDPQIARGRNLGALARAAAQGGATILQYRAKEFPTREMVSEARAIIAALQGTGVPLLINDRVDVALASGAAGVHLGREDMSPLDARALLGPLAIIGGTVKNEADLMYLATQPIDYACIGGVYATNHKDNADPPLGLNGFRALRATARDILGALPVGAIAGITPDNATALIQAGADGIAVIGAMFASDDPAKSARELSAAIARAG
jgi:thiamine-phosphate pyrophosphorylase